VGGSHKSKTDGAAGQLPRLSIIGFPSESPASGLLLACVVIKNAQGVPFHPPTPSPSPSALALPCVHCCQYRTPVGGVGGPYRATAAAPHRHGPVELVSPNADVLGRLLLGRPPFECRK
jgi:hypothetical protein